MFIPWLVKKKLDLHYMRNIVLSVEAENRKSHRKPVHNHTDALGAFKGRRARGFLSRGLLLLSLQS